MSNKNNKKVEIPLSAEEASELRAKLTAECERAERAEIESNIMLEMAVRTRELAVSFGCQVLPQSKPYAEEVKPIIENSVALSLEVERRLVDKRNRERKRRDVAGKTTVDHTLSTEGMSEVSKETVQVDSSVVSGVSRGEHEEGSGNGKGEGSDSRP